MYFIALRSFRNVKPYKGMFYSQMSLLLSSLNECCCSVVGETKEKKRKKRKNLVYLHALTSHFLPIDDTPSILQGKSAEIKRKRHTFTCSLKNAISLSPCMHVNVYVQRERVDFIIILHSCILQLSKPNDFVTTISLYLSVSLYYRRRH